MPWVYILRDDSGRHYIGMTADLATRLAQHRNGGTQTTRRMHGELHLVASKQLATRTAALCMERKLKAWKNPAKAIALLNCSAVG